MSITMIANLHWGPITIVVGGQELTIPGRRRPNGRGGHTETKFGYLDNVDKDAWNEWLGDHVDLDMVRNGVLYELKQHDQHTLRERDRKGGQPQSIVHPDPRTEQVRPMGAIGSNPMKFPT